MPPVNCCHVLLQLLAKNASNDAAGSIWATDVPGWITAVGTALLAVFAILTTIYAVRAFRKQSQEVSDSAEMLKVQSGQLAEQRKVNAEQIRVLALQAAELQESLAERKREAEQRHRAQASRVFIWQEYREGNPLQYETPPDYIAHLKPLPQGESRPLMVDHVKNASDQPVYDLVVRWSLGTAVLSESSRPKPLMPDEEQVQLLNVPPGEDFSLLTAAASFRDAAGVRWHSHPDGRFDEIPPDQPDQEQENTHGG